MNKNNLKITEKIIQYTEGRMNNSEKIEFEQELSDSEELRKQLEKYLTLSGEIKKIKNFITDETYFASILPRFRINQEKQRKLKLIPGLALGAALAAAVILFFTITTTEISEIQNGDSLTFSETEIDSLIKNYPDYTLFEAENEDTYSEYVEDIFIDELNISAQSLDSLVLYSSYSSYLDLFTEISDEEADLIYKQVINKELF